MATARLHPAPLFVPQSGLSYTWRANGGGGTDTRPPLPPATLLRTPRPGGWLRELLKEDAAPSPPRDALAHGGRPSAPMAPKKGGGGGCLQMCCACCGCVLLTVLGFMMITALVGMAVDWVKTVPCYPPGGVWAFGLAWIYAACYKWRGHHDGMYDVGAGGLGGVSAGCLGFWCCLLATWTMLGMVLSEVGACKSGSSSSSGSPGLLLYSTPFNELLGGESIGPGAFMSPFHNATGSLGANLSTMLLNSVAASALRLLDTAVEASRRGHAWSVD